MESWGRAESSELTQDHHEPVLNRTVSEEKCKQPADMRKNCEHPWPSAHENPNTVKVHLAPARVASIQKINLAGRGRVRSRRGSILNIQYILTF